MTIKKWHWALVTIGILIVLLILLTGTGERTVSNIFFIPAGTFNPVPGGNASAEKGTTDKAHEADAIQSLEQKIMDAELSIDEWNVSSPKKPQRNITILHVTDEDFKGYPELAKAMHDRKNSPPGEGSGWSLSSTGFGANQSDYDRFMNLVCRNKTRFECYADLPVFEYYGRYYYIGIALF
ncbi:MAG: hypothetical protein WC379_12045 [Methanoregula sp.]|jgi:hypothetical protein